jgi:DNA (cytosine-5)-methyltransferase 1
MLRVLDLFSGIGGFAIGLEKTNGFQTVAFCEMDPFCHQVLKKHWPETPIYDDVKTLTQERLQADGITVDVICGGFPCQDISAAGRGAGLAGERSGLWFEFHRLIKEIKPRYAIIENVSALRSRGLDKVLWSLAEIGYDAEWHCIPASSIGAPHQRDRIWIMAYPQCRGQQEGNVCFKRSDGRALSKGETVVSPESNTPSSSLADTSRVQQHVSKNDTEVSGASSSKFRDGSSTYNVADANGAQREGRCLSSRVFEKYANSSSNGWWETEPNVGRVAYGVPVWAHRLRVLGNAVVPQIPEIIGRAILASSSRL